MARPFQRTSRRSFLRGVSAGAFVTWLHDGAFGAVASKARPVETPRPRIVDLRLRTAASLEELKAFYHGKIGFTVLAEGQDAITFAAGLTPLTFVRATPADGRPFYHFAFNVPENKIGLARDWQRRHSPLIVTPPQLRDPRFPDDVRHFRSWNAHSVFFWDPAGNLVEYIARHGLDNAAGGKFGTRDILHASEIGFIVEEAARGELSRTLAEQLGWPGYEPTRLDGYCWALGDEHGLALLLPRGPRPNIDPSREVTFAVFPTEATLHAGRRVEHTVAGYPYRIVAE